MNVQTSNTSNPVVLNRGNSPYAVMKTIYLWFLGLAVLPCAVFARNESAPITEPLPPVDEVVPKVIARSKWSRAQNFQQFYSFTRSKVTEEFDTKGKIKSKQERCWRVPATKEAPESLLRNSTAATLNPESNEIGNEPSQVRRNGTSPPAKKRFIDIDEETIARFTFKPLRRELFHGRKTLVLAFEPKSDLPIKRLQDRFVNKAAGTLWVDELEYEVVKAEVRLKEPVSVGGGLIGDVQTFQYIFERTRVDDGVWLMAQSEMSIKARQFLTLVRTKKQQRWTDFKKATREG